MSRPRAADDFETIRSRIEELRRQRLCGEAATLPTSPGVPGVPGLPGDRGPCACGLSLFADECDGSCKAL